MQSLYKTIFLFFITTSLCSATHLVGGEIRAAHISGLTYNISAQIYFDADSGHEAADSQNSIQICFGDGLTGNAVRTSYTKLSGTSKGISLGVYEITHTYASSGNYQVSSALNNRSEDILNYNAPNSAMFLWTVLHTELANDTPILPPLVLTTGAKQIFKIDLKGTGSDKDSTSAYLQKLSSFSAGTCGVRMLDEQYIYPNDVTRNGTFYIDQADKKLVWNAPEKPGKYIYAFVIDEWRNGVKVSETYREGVVSVIDADGPTVEIPPYVAVSGTGVKGKPDGDYSNLSLAIEAYPVPTQDYLTVKVESKYATTLKIQIINLDGVIIKEIKTSTQHVEWNDRLDLRNVISGLYIVKATDENGKFVTKKIVR